jgi:hypothetical protein
VFLAVEAYLLVRSVEIGSQFSLHIIRLLGIVRNFRTDKFLAPPAGFSSATGSRAILCK